jgi:hypothetical protein
MPAPRPQSESELRIIASPGPSASKQLQKTTDLRGKRQNGNPSFLQNHERTQGIPRTTRHESLCNFSVWQQLIQVHYDDANVRTLNALLIGPEDTPYEYGMFEFQLVFPNGLCVLALLI